MGKYVSELISHIPAGSRVVWRFFGDRPETTFHRPDGRHSAVELFDFKGYRFHTWEQIGLPWRARNLQVLHGTATTLPYWQPLPTIVTLHDTLPWKSHISNSYERWYRHRLIPSAYKKCAAVITISESSRRDILELWPWLEPKIHVIPHGVADIYLRDGEFALANGLKRLIGGSPYFLYIGGALKRKRFDWALDVFRRLTPATAKLLVCGFSEAEREEAHGALDPKLLQRVIFLPYVPESEMPALYQKSVAVLYPTLYEGFGFPALEAQAVGAPVLFSDLSSLSELKGPGTELLPVDDRETWVRSCNQLLARRAVVQEPNAAARTWAAQYSWSASAERHLDVYRRVARRERA